MREPKTYNAALGVAIDDCFANHIYSCEQCKAVDVAKTAALATLCLEGSILWKRENGVKVTKEREEKKDTVVSKAEVKKVMRYK